MKFKKGTVFILLATILFVACGDDNTTNAEATIDNEKNSENENVTEEKTPKKENNHSLEGVWEIIRAEGIAARTNVGTVYTFNGNELIMGKGGLNNPGKTEITDSTFSFQSEGIDYKFLYNYYFKGDTLVTSMENSKGQMFYMIKK